MKLSSSFYSVCIVCLTVLVIFFYGKLFGNSRELEEANSALLKCNENKAIKDAGCIDLLVEKKGYSYSKAKDVCQDLEKVFICENR